MAFVIVGLQLNSNVSLIKLCYKASAYFINVSLIDASKGLDKLDVKISQV